MAKYVFAETNQESWLDQMEEEQFIKLKECKDQVITITNAFFYDSVNVGAEGVTFKFKVKDLDAEYYTTSFSKVIVKQFHDGLMDAVADEPQEVKVVYKKSKQGKDYPMFVGA